MAQKLALCFLVAALMVGITMARRNYSNHKAASQYNKSFELDYAGYCRLSKLHTMCQFRESVGHKCSPMLGGGVNAADRATILEAHNKYRQRVAQGSEGRGSPGPQPPAANMREMIWDEELARVAQRWANQCHYAHDEKRNVLRGEVGQNIYAWSTNGYPNASAAWIPAIKSLYDEARLYSAKNISPFHWRPATSHYTQIVWANTYAIGCGYSMYKKKGEKEWTDKFYVCNYGPTGNIANQSLYKKGKPCSQCPSGTSCRNKMYPSLCS